MEHHQSLFLLLPKLHPCFPRKNRCPVISEAEGDLGESVSWWQRKRDGGGRKREEHTLIPWTAVELLMDSPHLVYQHTALLARPEPWLSTSRRERRGNARKSRLRALPGVTWPLPPSLSLLPRLHGHHHAPMIMKLLGNRETAVVLSPGWDHRGAGGYAGPHSHRLWFNYSGADGSLHIDILWSCFNGQPRVRPLTSTKKGENFIWWLLLTLLKNLHNF